MFLPNFVSFSEVLRRKPKSIPFPFYWKMIQKAEFGKFHLPTFNFGLSSVICQCELMSGLYIS